MVGGCLLVGVDHSALYRSRTTGFLPSRQGCRRGGTSLVDDMKSSVRALEIEAITDADIPAVAAFFHDRLSSGASAADWCRVMNLPWDVEQPNHGYLLRENGCV